MSITLVVALAAVVVGSSMAVFSDQEVVAGNTVAMGTLEVTVNDSAGKPFSVTNAYPGWMLPNWEYIDILNTGTLPLEAHMSFQKTSGSSQLYNQLTILLKTSGWDSDCSNGDAGEKVIYNGKIKDFTPQTLVSDIAYWHLANEDDGSGPNDNIRVGWSERVCQKVGVHVDAGNAIMGTSVEFSEIVDAMQDND